MSVRYKFKNSLTHYKTITFAGGFISLNDFKDAVFKQKKLNRVYDDLKIVNADTKHEYKFVEELIPKNTRLIVSRIPRNLESKEPPINKRNLASFEDVDSLDKGLVGNLAQLNISKEEEIGLMMEPSTTVYNRRIYQKENEAPVVPVPKTLQCSRCYLSGHWVKDCPLALTNKVNGKLKKTGVPETLQQNHIPASLQERNYEEKQAEISPEAGIPNRLLHKSVQSFSNQRRLPEKTMLVSNNVESRDGTIAKDYQK